MRSSLAEESLKIQKRLDGDLERGTLKKKGKGKKKGMPLRPGDSGQVPGVRTEADRRIRKLIMCVSLSLL